MPHGGADNTQKILDVLADYGVKATFFVVGNWADQYPEQAKAIVDSGCELMNHSRAPDWQSRGQRFDPANLHHEKP